MPPTLYAVAHPKPRRPGHRPPVHESFGNLALRRTRPRNAQRVMSTTELLEWILLACPVDRLMRCRTVCERWNHLISHKSPQLRVRWFRYDIWNYPTTDMRLLDYPTPGLRIRLGDTNTKGQLVEVEMDIHAAMLIFNAERQIRDAVSRSSQVLVSPAEGGEWTKVEINPSKIHLDKSDQKTHYTTDWRARYTDDAKLLVSQPPFTRASVSIIDTNPERQARPDVTGVTSPTSTLTAEIYCDAGIDLGVLAVATDWMLYIHAMTHAKRSKIPAKQHSFMGLSVKFESLVKWKNTDAAPRRRLKGSEIEITRHGAHYWSNDSGDEDSNDDDDDGNDDDGDDSTGRVEDSDIDDEEEEEDEDDEDDECLHEDDGGYGARSAR
ncbi:hypothetical protein B0A48_15661 [Cryoendolithus antarcticus]|uniref:F-box domain-containing protein n=1 Tax=Cryoendolithus antarcticus TaxID=1507870 RepID=A0A1V8SH25_9PEZI|nr:hypothetical protein B0A48_15661 [Cryoendolithus antarcticus]